MDAVTVSSPPEPPSAEIIDLAAYRRARTEARRDSPHEEPADPYPWAYTFRAPEGG
jgi:hypothetical protein